MGTFSKERFVYPGAWRDVKIELMGPYTCLGDINKYCTMKIWAAVLENVNSRAGY